MFQYEGHHRLSTADSNTKNNLQVAGVLARNFLQFIKTFIDLRANGFCLSDNISYNGKV